LVQLLFWCCLQHITVLDFKHGIEGVELVLQLLLSSSHLVWRKT